MRRLSGIQSHRNPLYKPARADQSSRAPDRRTTSAHFAESSLISSANSSGEPPAATTASAGSFRPSLAASVAVFLKLVLMPVIAVTLALQFGLADSNLAVVTICSAVPTASSAYVLARQMGGDAPLLAQIITLQTILAAATMPVAIALAAMF